MTATTIPLRSPWTRLASQRIHAWLDAWGERRRMERQLREMADAAALDERTLHDVGLADWVRSDVLERREMRRVALHADGVDLWAR